MKKFLSKKLNSKGAVSVLLMMSILAAILAISLGSSAVVVNETRSSSGSGESVGAYYAAESALENAIYEITKNAREPQVNRCADNCPTPACAWEDSWTCTVTSLDASPHYCVEITEGTSCDKDTITKIKAEGKSGSTRRSVEINFGN